MIVKKLCELVKHLGSLKEGMLHVSMDESVNPSILHQAYIIAYKLEPTLHQAYTISYKLEPQ